MIPEWMKAIYVFGLFVSGLAWFLGTLFLGLVWSDAKLRDKKKAARQFLACLFGGPVAGVVWPLVVLGFGVFFMTCVVRDALKMED